MLRQTDQQFTVMLPRHWHTLGDQPVISEVTGWRDEFVALSRTVERFAARICTQRAVPSCDGSHGQKSGYSWWNSRVSRSASACPSVVRLLGRRRFAN